MVDLTGFEPALTTHDTPRLVPLVWLQAQGVVYPIYRLGLAGK